MEARRKDRKHKRKHKHKSKDGKDKSHKKKKKHKRDHSENGSSKSKRPRTEEDEELARLEEARAQLQAQLNGSTDDGTAIKAISLIAQGYGSESEEEGEVEHVERKETLKTAREILKDIPKNVLAKADSLRGKGGDGYTAISDNSDIIDVDDEFDARNYRTVVLAEQEQERNRLRQERSERIRDKEREKEPVTTMSTSDIEIIEDLSRGPISKPSVKNQRPNREEERKKKKEKSRKSPSGK